MLLAACCWHGNALAFPGDPLLQRFTPADFKATPYLFGLAEDSSGRLYVGNGDGVLRLQGREWETIALPGGMAAYALARARDGRVYLAGHDSFGVIVTANDGHAIFHDLRDAFGLKGEQRTLGWMSQVIPVEDGVYFRAQTRLLFYRFDGQHKQWPLSEDEGILSAWHGHLYNQNKTEGLRRFEDGRLLPVAGGALMREHSGAELIDQGDSALAVSVNGFFRLHAGQVTALDVPPMPASAGIFQSVHALPAGDFVVGTTAGELLRYDGSAHLLASYKIARSSIGGLEYDTENGLWASSEDELVRLQLPSPWSRIDVGNLGGVIGDCELHRGALWLAVGSRGLARMTEKNGAVETDWIAAEDKQQIFNMASTTDGLLVAYDSGIDVIDDDDHVKQLAHHEQPVFSIVMSHYDHDLAYAAGDEGVYLLRRHDRQWAVAALFPAPELATQTVAETAPGVIWVNNTRGMPERWSIDTQNARLLKREHFALDAPGRSPGANQATQLVALSGKAYVALDKDAYVFNGKAFVPFSGPPFTYMQSPNSFAVLETPIGAFAYTGSRLYRRDSKGHWKQEDIGAQYPASQALLRYGSDGVLRLSVWRALLQYDPTAKAAPPLPSLAIRLTGVSRTLADGQIDDLPISEGGPPVFEQDQTLNLHFAVFTAEPGVEYRYRSPGIFDTFTSWRDQPTLGFSGLDQPGEHMVEVEARLPSGRVVQPLHYAFTIAPRWYQMTLVRLLAALAALVLLLVLVRWRERSQTRQYAQRQRQLEAKITERTLDLEAANRKLEELATEDGLTGIANRRALETGLQREWRRCLDLRAPITLLMIDVDHFKQYNDRHGHLAGDGVLKHVARQLTAGHDPQRELLARYGGEEFCLLLPGIALDAARQRAEVLRKMFDGSASAVTVSIGVAACVPRNADRAEELLRSADQMLYEAKRRGRNQVVVADCE